MKAPRHVPFGWQVSFCVQTLWSSQGEPAGRPAQPSGSQNGTGRPMSFPRATVSVAGP